MTDETSDERTETDVSTHSSTIVYERDTDERPSEAVIRAVATLTNTAVLDLDPLYDVIDPVHLDGILDGTGSISEESSITFSFNGCLVTVTQQTVRVDANVD